MRICLSRCEKRLPGELNAICDLKNIISMVLFSYSRFVCGSFRNYLNTKFDQKSEEERFAACRHCIVAITMLRICNNATVLMN